MIFKVLCLYRSRLAFPSNNVFSQMNTQMNRSGFRRHLIIVYLMKRWIFLQQFPGIFALLDHITKYLRGEELEENAGFNLIHIHPI